MSDPKSQKSILDMLKIAVCFAVAWAVFNLCSVHVKADEKTLSFEWNQTREVYEDLVDRHLVDFFKGCAPRKITRARAIAPIMIDVCERENVNPCLIASTISYESSWNPKLQGKVGELGLMQVNNMVLSDDPEEQITRGIEILKHSYEHCGHSVIGALSYYATGKTCKPYSGSKRKFKRALRIEAGL